MRVHWKSRWRRNGPRKLKFKIREWREVRALTQAELAKLADTSKACISRWERWTRDSAMPTLTILERIAKTLKVGIKDLFEE